MRRCALGEAAAAGDRARGEAFALLAAGFVVWTGITILWSVLPDRSWDYFNRGLAYFVFAVLGAFVGSLVAPRVVAWMLGGLVALTCVWALAGKVVPALYGDYGRLARLRSPVGYWNALALVTVFGIPIALWAATRRHGGRCVRARSWGCTCSCSRCCSRTRAGGS